MEPIALRGALILLFVIAGLLARKGEVLGLALAFVGVAIALETLP